MNIPTSSPAGRMMHWFLPATSLLILAGALTVAGYMYLPWPPGSIGIAGDVAMHYPLSLLVLSIPSLLLLILAMRKKRKLSMLLLSLAFAVSVTAAIAPVLAQFNRAHRYGVKPDPWLLFQVTLNRGDYLRAHSVVYSRYPDEEAVFLDVWPVHDGNSRLRPALLKIHGGTWSQGSRIEATGWNQWFNEMGYVVFDVDYRLPPPARWKEETSDVKAALGWISEHAEQYRVDTNRIVVMGIAEGANLALLAAYTYGHPALTPSFGRKEARARCVIDLYGPTDLVTFFHRSGSAGTTQPLMKKYLGGGPEEFPERYRLLSPLTHVQPGIPPTLVLHGESDRVCPVEQSILLEETLKKKRVPNEFYYLPSCDHRFDDAWNSIGAQVARHKIRNFLSTYNMEIPAPKPPEGIQDSSETKF